MLLRNRAGYFVASKVNLRSGFQQQCPWSRKFLTKVLSIAFKRKLLITLPSATFGRASLIIVMSLAAKAAILAPSRRDAAHFAMFVHRIADPVDARVIPYDFMHRIDHDNFIVLVNRILVQPVRV